jgi:hypothetical protein
MDTIVSHCANALYLVSPNSNFFAVHPSLLCFETVEVQLDALVREVILSLFLPGPSKLKVIASRILLTKFSTKQEISTVILVTPSYT